MTGVQTCALPIYQFAESCGMAVTERIPSLVPLVVREEFVKELQGLSLKNVEAVVYDGKREIYRDFGEMLFTHFGVSGPLILSASSYVAKILGKRELKLVIDLKPGLVMNFSKNHPHPKAPK